MLLDECVDMIPIPLGFGSCQACAHGAKAVGIRLISLRPSLSGKFIVLRTGKALRFAGGVQIELIVPLRSAPGITILDGRSYACTADLRFCPHRCSGSLA
jgi:hypothetical protein